MVSMMELLVIYFSENTFKSKEDPLIYVKFLTDEPVVLKNSSNSELIELVNSCTHLKDLKAFKSLDNYVTYSPEVYY